MDELTKQQLDSVVALVESADGVKLLRAALPASWTYESKGQTCLTTKGQQLFAAITTLLSNSADKRRALLKLDSRRYLQQQPRG